MRSLLRRLAILRQLCELLQGVSFDCLTYPFVFLPHRPVDGVGDLQLDLIDLAGVGR